MQHDNQINVFLFRYTHIEGECPFIDFEDLLVRIEDLVSIYPKYKDCIYFFFLAMISIPKITVENDCIFLNLQFFCCC